VDIETVPGARTFDSLSDEMKALFDLKAGTRRPEDRPLTEYYHDRGAIWAEFGRVVCISAGFLHQANGARQFRVKSFAGHDEARLLTTFADLIASHYKDPGEDKLCGHNIIEFDIPFICRRMLINGLTLPEMLNLHAKKPWEVPLLDTMDLWKFGDRKNFTSLRLLTHVLGIATPKDDIQGSDVGHVYWELGDLPRIVTYCQKDVVAVMQVLLRFRGEQLLADSEIVITQG
jgi:hypothetical protein